VSALPTVSAVDALAGVLRERILDGELLPGERLREHDLAGRYAVARHTLRAALQRLAAEGLVRIERNRGATVARLDPDELRGLFELRTALEVEAAHLALRRHGGRLPAGVHEAQARLSSTARRRGARWADVGAGHDALHRAIVEASGSARLVAAHAALAGELRLFVTQLRPTWSGSRMATQHEDLLAALEREGAVALRAHLEEGLASLLG
jgi:DNA-binding GntR family transcriptional regulator